MHPKLARLEAYLEDGFEVEEIVSDDERMEVHVHRGLITVILTFSAEDALSILRWTPRRDRGAIPPI